MSDLKCLPKFGVILSGSIEIDTTSSSGTFRNLSPFVLPPKGYPECKIFENLWQFSKVYREHLGLEGNPNGKWLLWAAEGFGSSRPHRYPMGKGRIPEYSWWEGQKLGYIAARKQIYAPIYAESVRETDSYKKLTELYQRLKESNTPMVLRDYDAYDHAKLGMTLKDVINCPTRKMGHAFVLAMMLTDTLEECLT